MLAVGGDGQCHPAGRQGDLASLAGETTIFGRFAAEKLERLQAELEPLSRRYDVVVANPPYMGSSSLGKWMGAWVKKYHPEAYRDLCTSFIDRGFGMSSDNGYSAMVTMQSWMFLGSFEKLRGKILRNHSISSMAHLGTRAFGAIGGEVVSTTATVFANAKSEVKGAYFRLVDMGSEEEKQAGLLEALADPDCGWFYRADADGFGVIPGSPIAYWATNTVMLSFRKMPALNEYCDPRQGFATGENNRFLRFWWEPDRKRSAYAGIEPTARKWHPCNKGGGYRKWYGNNELLVNWENDGEEMKAFPGSVIRNPQYYFKRGMTWGTISSAILSMRYSPDGFLFESKGSVCFPHEDSNLFCLLGLTNSAVVIPFLELLCPTLDFHEGPIGKIPTSSSLVVAKPEIDPLVTSCIDNSKQDWDAFETSWDFKNHPLI